MFKITGGKGFHIKFDNGYTVSVQFGGGSYSQNYHEEISTEAYIEQGKRGSDNAEVAVFKDGEGLIKMFDGDNVKGYQTPKEVLELLIWAESQPT